MDEKTVSKVRTRGETRQHVRLEQSWPLVSLSIRFFGEACSSAKNPADRAKMEGMANYFTISPAAKPCYTIFGCTPQERMRIISR